MAARNESPTIFVSSTCFDLVDLRAELYQELTTMGLSPLMSDVAVSDFMVDPQANSIETCLVNVRRSDIVIVILSQRYGPSLSRAGFDDISATHLEYREARRCNKPVYMYVRDRLEADFSIWKRNAGATIRLPWVAEKDLKLLELLEEHRALASTAPHSNWFWTFRDSLDLKERLRKDLDRQSGSALLRRLIESGRVAYLIPNVVEWKLDGTGRALTIKLEVLNYGTAAAIGPFVSLLTDSDEHVESIMPLMPGGSARVSFHVPLSAAERKSKNPAWWVHCMFTTPEGHVIVDEAYLEGVWGWKKMEDGFTVDYQGKRYVHSSGIRISTESEASAAESQAEVQASKD